MTTLALAAVSYSIPGAVEASGVSESSIRAAVKEGELVAHYLGTKPVILSTDLYEWIQSLPTEKGGRA